MWHNNGSNPFEILQRNQVGMCGKGIRSHRVVPEREPISIFTHIGGRIGSMVPKNLALS
jgi:hypothetical protein